MNQRYAIVTGGTRGIGEAITLNLAEQGYKVFAIYARDRNSAADLEKKAEEKGYQIKTLRGDLTDESKLMEVLDGIRSETDIINTVIHAAASGVHRDALSLTKKHISWTFNINVFAIHNLLREVVPMMPEGSRIVGITSNGGERVIPHYAAVGSSKGALNSLFRHYAYELAPKGIGVNLVCPGMVVTKAIEAFPNKEERLQTSIDSTPSGRLTMPEDVANLVSFLCSPAAAQIVGQSIVMDGGKSLLG